MQNKKIAFLGSGNMARSLISGLIKAGIPAKNIHATGVNSAKIEHLAGELDIVGSTNNTIAAKNADVIVLAVKPQFMADMLSTLSDSITDYSGKLVISIAAGVSITQLSKLLHGHTNIIRCMPNTPSLIGAGITGLFASDIVSAVERHFTEAMFTAIGKSIWVDTEADINKITAISGSGPAYFFFFMQAMVEEAQRMGFTADTARVLVQETALGAAKLVINKPEIDLITLREQVTSKGGTTAAAIRVFEEGNLSILISNAMKAALYRSEEIEKSC